MMQIVISTIFLLMISLVSSTPTNREKIISIPMKKNRAAAKPSTGTIHAVDSARIANLKGTATASTAFATGVAIATNLVDIYTVVVKIGSQSFQNMVVDTGTAVTWVGGSTNRFLAGSTGESTGKAITVSTGFASVSGTEYGDTVTLGGLTAYNQYICVINSNGANDFGGIDGVIGFGPIDLTEGALSGGGTVPTFMDNLYNQGTISVEALGIYFTDESGSDSNDANGVLTLGGTDSSLYSGSITYTSRVGDYWGIAITEVVYGSTSLGSIPQAVVDTGTTLLYIPTAIYDGFVSASGGKYDDETGLVKYTSKPAGNLSLTIGGTVLTLTPSDYLLPLAQYNNWGLEGSAYYTYISDGGDEAPDCILGMSFLTKFYSVYDSTNNRVGLAVAV